MPTTLSLEQVVQKIKNVKNSTTEDIAVGTLLFNLGLEFITAGKEIKDDKGKLIGEIDLIFIDEEEDILFVIEVSKKEKNASQKIDHFLSKWSNDTNIKYLKKRLQKTQKRIHKINFDLSSKNEIKSSSLNHILENPTNKIISKSDLRYFEETYKAIGKWARNDLYSFLEIKPKSLHTLIPAIVFYIGDHRAFIYADYVGNILKYSYVSRRRQSDIGYQRMVQQSRVGSIAKTIRKNKTITFPNSIILNSKSLLTTKTFKREDCPTSVDIHIPKTFCNFRIIDGQHRIMGFAKMGDYKRDEYILPIVILEDLTQAKEVQTFIEINHKQKKLDSNLILTLKKDFDWQVEDVEYFEKISVLVAQKLNANSELKGNVYFGYADEKKGNKITVTTLHSVIKKNNLTGIKTHLYQQNVSDIETPYRRIKDVFSIIAKYFKQNNHFFFSNMGLRILFRILQLFEKNTLSGNIALSIDEVIKHLYELFRKNNLLAMIDEHYGEGGARAATEKVIEELKKHSNKYDLFETDLRKI